MADTMVDTMADTTVDTRNELSNKGHWSISAWIAARVDQWRGIVNWSEITVLAACWDRILKHGMITQIKKAILLLLINIEPYLQILL